MKRLLILTFLITPVFFQGQAQAQIDSLKRLNAITTAVPLLLITPDARAGAMGDVGVSTSPDANSIRWNAAKLAFSEKKMGVALSYIPWMKSLVNDIDMSYLAAYRKLDDQQAISVSLLYFSLGNIIFTDEAGNVIGNHTPREMAFDMAYARQLSRFFSGSITARYITSNLTGGTPVQGQMSKPARAVAADLGAYYTNDDLVVGENDATLNLGMQISNLGNKVSYTNAADRDFLPMNLRLGGTFTLRPDEFNSIGFTAEFNKLLVPTPPLYGQNGVIAAGKDPNVGVVTGLFQSFTDAPGGAGEELREVNPSLGVEYWYDQQFAVRAGYFYESPTKGDRQYFTVGAGLKYSVFGLDVAYLITNKPTNPLKNTLHFTLLFDFDAFGSQNSNQ